MDVNFSSLPSLQPQPGSQGSGNSPPSTGGGTAVKTLQANPDSVVVQSSESSGPKNDGEGASRDERPRPTSAQQALDSLRFSSRRTQIGFNDELNQVFLEVVDTRTDQVVEQIPSEEFVRFVNQQLEPAERRTSSGNSNGAVVDEAI